jgi:hypothetical protein
VIFDTSVLGTFSTKSILNRHQQSIVSTSRSTGNGVNCARLHAHAQQALRANCVLPVSSTEVPSSSDLLWPRHQAAVPHRSSVPLATLRIVPRSSTDPQAATAAKLVNWQSAGFSRSPPPTSAWGPSPCSLCCRSAPAGPDAGHGGAATNAPCWVAVAVGYRIAGTSRRARLGSSNGILPARH